MAIDVSARILHDDRVANMGAIDSHALLRELGFDLSKFKGHNERVLVNSDRVSPGGPDPQHHH
ncbi:hypothetical protein Bca101_042778 [Brassica carinata]